MSLNRIMLVGEAWGEEEEKARAPFQGMSGRLLTKMLRQAGINRAASYITNVFNLRPQPKNDISNLCGPKATGLPGYPALKAGKYVRAEYAEELERLYAEIRQEDPNVIVALGGTPAWALLAAGQSKWSGIKRARGAPSLTSPTLTEKLGRQYKVLPTWHPAAVMREWSLRATTVIDLMKAKEEAQFPELRRPSRRIWIEPTIADLVAYDRDFIGPADSLSVDIETSRGLITCVGFAPSSDSAIVVPFVDPTQHDGNYWRSLSDELVAWAYVRKWCTEPRRVVGQNFLYDMNWLWTQMGIPVPPMQDDTMLLHHALEPELEKGLGFLATIYTKELSWKFMRTKHLETTKRED